MAKTATTKSSKSSGLKYSDVVKAQGGVATNPQTGAKTYSKSSAPKGGGNFAVRGDNAELLQDVDPSKAPSSGGIPNYGGLAPTPTTQPIDAAPIQQPPTPDAATITPQQGLSKALESGIQPPQDAGEARSAIQQYLPQESNTFYKPQANSEQVYNAAGEALSYDQYIAQGGKPDFSNVRNGLPQNTQVEQQMAQDPIYGEILKAYKEQNDIVAQKDSLLAQYDKITKQSGLPAINAELISIQNVINGTEDDIRREVQAAAGVATNSQVMALAASRNKTLIQRYDQLVSMKEMAQQNVNTMIGLAAQDRDFALQAINQKLNILGQVDSYRQKFLNNAKEGYANVINAMGYGGLYQSLQNDPWSVALAEKTLNMQPGQLALLAAIPGEVDTQVVTANGRSLLINTQTGETIRDLGGAYKASSGGGGGSGRSGGSSSTGLKPTADTASEIKAWILANKRANPNIPYYDLWGQLSDELNNQGLNSSNFDPQFWEILHPEGLAGYNSQKKKSQPSGNSNQLTNPFG